MDLAKPGEIKHHCDPNALSTFLEYLEDYGSAETVDEGEKLIAQTIETMGERERATSIKLIDQVRDGKRDCLV
jgi:2-iminoacetate synthase